MVTWTVVIIIIVIIIIRFLLLWTIGHMDLFYYDSHVW